MMLPHQVMDRLADGVLVIRFGAVEDLGTFVQRARLLQVQVIPAALRQLQVQFCNLPHQIDPAGHDATSSSPRPEPAPWGGRNRIFYRLCYCGVAFVGQCRPLARDISTPLTSRGELSRWRADAAGCGMRTRRSEEH